MYQVRFLSEYQEKLCLQTPTYPNAGDVSCKDQHRYENAPILLRTWELYDELV